MWNWKPRNLWGLARQIRTDRNIFLFFKVTTDKNIFRIPLFRNLYNITFTRSIVKSVHTRFVGKIHYYCTRSTSTGSLFSGQDCGSAFISSGSGSSNLGWIPIRIWIQYGSVSNPDPGHYWPKLKKKITAENKFKKFWIKNYNLLIPSPL